MQLSVQTFTGLVQRMTVSVQASANQMVDVSVGSILRAILEACAATTLWMQWLILQVLSMTRASSSLADDLDSWMADFGLTRLAGSSSSGMVTFSRYSLGMATVVPVGTKIRTSDGKQIFLVTSAPAHPGWNGSNGYAIDAFTQALNVPVLASLPGPDGNVMPGTCTGLMSPIPGVDQVTNMAGIAGGTEAESDPALRLRFIQYINSRSLGTELAIKFAISSVAPGLRYTVLENQDRTGKLQIGTICVTVDDGSGLPPDSLIMRVSDAVDLVRPVGCRYSVAGPVITSAAVEIYVELANDGLVSEILEPIRSMVFDWIASLPMGGTLAASKVAALTHGAAPAVLSVRRVLLNGLAVDLVTPSSGVIIPVSLSVI